MQSRRDLAKTLGVAVATLPFAAARAAEPTPTPTPTPTPAPQPADAVALALTQAAVVKFALTAEEATKVGESIVRIRRSARVLGALKLSPAEEPLWNGVPADADGVK